MQEDFCETLCFMEPTCISYNLMMKSETGKYKCELNNATHEGHEQDLEENSSYFYRGAKVNMGLDFFLFLLINNYATSSNFLF